MRLSQFRSLADALPGAPPPGALGDPGLFGPTSTAWYVGRERVLLAGGAAALLLQVAHPLVAAGVRAHSGFRDDPLRRLHATLDATLTITFGDTAQAAEAAGGVRRRHRQVRGTLPEATGRLPAGTSYRAADPDLALWVFTTLVWSAITVREQFIGRLTPRERDAYYDEIKEFGRLFGVLDDRFPRDYRELERYFQRMVDTELAVGSETLVLARDILTPSVPVLTAPLRSLPRVLSAGVLPNAVREMYGLRWRRRDQLLYATLHTVTRAVVPVLPGRIRYWPHYRQAMCRASAGLLRSSSGSGSTG